MVAQEVGDGSTGDAVVGYQQLVNDVAHIMQDRMPRFSTAR